MKTIHIDDDLYQYIASQTQNIGESASEILRRLLLGDANAAIPEVEEIQNSVTSEEQDDVVETATESVFNFLNKEEVATQKGAVGRFLFILASLHRAHGKNFSKVLTVKGRERNYFGTSAEDLEQHGHSIKPKSIPDSEYWVVTNNNTPRKKLIINEVAISLGYTPEEAETLREYI